MFLALFLIVLGLAVNSGQAAAANEKARKQGVGSTQQKIDPVDRLAASLRFKKQFTSLFAQTDRMIPPVLDPVPGSCEHAS